MAGTHRSAFVVLRHGERREEVSAEELCVPAPPPAVRQPPTLRLPSVLADVLPSSVMDAVASVSVLCANHASEGCHLEEIRLRAGRRASLTVGGRNVMTDIRMTETELFDILTRMCGGSLYTYSESINEGFITLPGGVRVGVAGRAACEMGRVIGVREIASLCIRIPHVHRQVGGELCHLLRKMMTQGGAPCGILIYAPPGEGKTTLLRGVAAGLASGTAPLRTVVVDTRGELTFPDGGEGLCLDILTGYPRSAGISIATRSLGAQVIVCDEIGDCDEAISLMSAYNGGVPLVATAHGGEIGEILRRTGIRLLHEARLFGVYVRIRRNGRGGFDYDIKEWEEADHAL